MVGSVSEAPAPEGESRSGVLLYVCWSVSLIPSSKLTTERFLMLTTPPSRSKGWEMKKVLFLKTIFLHLN